MKITAQISGTTPRRSGASTDRMAKHRRTLRVTMAMLSP